MGVLDVQDGPEVAITVKRPIALSELPSQGKKLDGIWSSKGLTVNVGPLYKTVNVDEIELFTVARYVLIIPLIFITLLHLRERCRPRARHRALVISFVSMWEFSVKITYYTLLSEGYGLAFQNQRSFDYRPIYATRWMGWFFAIPTLLFMNLYPIMEDYPASAVVKRIFPQQACSAAYCWTCYLGCIIYDPWFGWFLNILGCVGYVVVIVDEAVLVAEHMLSTKQPILKGYSIIVKECIFVMYTCVWLMGCWSYTGSYAVQRFYTVSDVSLKATMSGLMFLYWNTEEAMDLKRIIELPEKVKVDLVLSFLSVLLERRHTGLCRLPASTTLPAEDSDGLEVASGGSAGSVREALDSHVQKSFTGLVKLLKFESKREAKVCELAAAYLKVQDSVETVEEWFTTGRPLPLLV
ncbi:Uncharacterized protein SCF082_LOCUS26801 [Durusdinium trenchii]|uniref:Uncharacterized protein n=1 Tax=Durusdinium trenchii TaxID=1381693 RepID=A0ABP0MB69_9DINO